MATARKDDMDRSAEFEASREAARAALENLLEAKEHFKKAAEAAGIDLKHEAADKLHEGRDRAEALGEQLYATANMFVTDKPLSTLSIAFIGGFLIAQMLGRK
jgi:ElaB/YqjD/DUF883 family membrane-anchored ribosome-binding protein